MPGSARFVLASAVCAVLSCLAPSARAAGDPTLMIDRIEGEPVAVERGEFAAKDPEWLRTLSLHIRNMSGKAVSYVDFDVNVLGVDGKTVGYDMRYGAADPKAEPTNAKPIGPQKELKLQWVGDDYKHLKERLTAGGVFYPAAAVFRLKSVTFVDGTTWSDGRH